MDSLFYAAIVLLGLAFIGAASGMGRAKRFQALGDISGMPLEELVAKVGPPTSASAMPDGTLYQWLHINELGSAHFAILFDRENRAIGYTHQHVS